MVSLTEGVVGVSAWVLAFQWFTAGTHCLDAFFLILFLHIFLMG